MPKITPDSLSSSKLNIFDLIKEIKELELILKEKNNIIFENNKKLTSEVWLSTRLSLLNEEEKLRKETNQIKKEIKSLKQKISYRKNKINNIRSNLSLEEKIDLLIDLFIEF